MQGVLGPEALTSLLAAPLLAADQASPLVPRVARRVRPVRGEFRLIAQLARHKSSEHNKALVRLNLASFEGVITETLSFIAKKWGCNGGFHAVFISEFVLFLFVCLHFTGEPFSVLQQHSTAYLFMNQPSITSFQLKISN